MWLWVTLEFGNEVSLDVLILGCGFTGIRVARRFLDRGARVTVTTRDPSRLAGFRANIIRLSQVPEHLRKGMLVLHSIPPEGSTLVPEMLKDAPARIVYLSSTSVYGTRHLVDEESPVDIDDIRARPRIAEEVRIAKGPWSALILRPAAIYGPGRGAHESLLRGTYVAADNFVSRIHVDDLAAHSEAGLLSDVTGAFPVGDEEPATTRAVADFCKQLLRLEELPVTNARASRTMANRKVDGSAIRRVLGLTLKYPSYRIGIPAALADR